MTESKLSVKLQKQGTFHFDSPAKSMFGTLMDFGGSGRCGGPGTSLKDTPQSSLRLPRDGLRKFRTKNQPRTNGQALGTTHVVQSHCWVVESTEECGPLVVDGLDA